MIRRLPLLLSGCLAACSAVPPPDAEIGQLKRIVYQDSRGQRLLPVARSVPDAQSRLWRQWLQQHRSRWHRAYGETVSGRTHWCAQWQQDGQTERVCKRGSDTLVWLGRGLLRDGEAVAQADAVWRSEPF